MLKNYISRKVPEYYDTMFMDGFTPEEILQAKRKQMLEEIEDRETTDDFSILSEIKIK